MSHRTIGLVTQNSPDYVLRTFALWDSGATVVPLRSADDHHRMRLADVAHVESPNSGSGWLDVQRDICIEDKTAQIAFTSGTEGEPKGVVLTHHNLADSVNRLNTVMHVTNEIREYIGVPVFHSFGYGRCRAVAAAGGKSFIPARGFNPLEVNSMLERGQINAISAVPSLWRLLMQSSAISAQAAANVRWIEIGSQFMTGEEKHALRKLFSGARIIQHYGLTEASRSTFLEVDSVSIDQLESVGKPYGDVEIRISNDGRIMVRGPNVAVAILSSEGRADPRDREGWLVTNDLGFLKDGFLYYQGRADDVINCGGIKVAPDAMEQLMRTALGPSGEFAVCRIPDSERGEGILVAATHAVTSSDTEIKDAAVVAAHTLGINARDATHVLRCAELARTENGKIQRKEIAKLFSTRSDMPQSSEEQGAEESLRLKIASILGIQQVANHDTFVTLGGDSLRYIQASVAIEKTLGYLPEGWEQRPIADLDRLAPRTTKFAQIEPSVLLRAIAIVSVVINHAGIFESLFAIDGAAFMLLLPAGYSFARFQLQRVLGSGQAIYALSTLPRVVVPALLLIGIQQIRHRHFEPSAIFFYNNFLGAPTLSFWFIEVFVQIHLILALILLHPGLRRLVRQSAWTTSVVTLGISLLVAQVTPWLWDTTDLYNRVPHQIIWYFFLGWCILFANSSWQRWANTIFIVSIGVALGALHWPPDSRGLWIIFGGLFLNWASPLRLPIYLARGISVLASASLYIYTSHFLLLEPVARAIPQAKYLAPIVISLLGGILFWFCFEKTWQTGQKLLRRAPTTSS